MSRTDDRRRSAGRVPPSDTVEYGSIVIVLSLSALIRILLDGVIRDLSDLHPYHVTTAVYGTLVYGTIGLAVLGLGYLLHRRARGGDGRLDDAGYAQLLLAVALAIVFVSYLVSNAATPSTSLIGSFVISVVGMGALSVAYSRVRSTGLRLGRPADPTVRVLSVAALLPALLVVLRFVAYRELGPSSWPFGGRYVLPVSIVHLGQTVVIPSSFAGFGASLLFHGAIQETLRGDATPTGAVAGVTVLIGLHRLVTARLFALDGVALLLAVVPAVALVVLVAALVVRLWRVLGRTASDVQPGVATAAAFGTVVTALLLAGWYVTLGMPSARFAGDALVYTATIGVAAATYERTRSVWVPALAVASFHAATDLVPYLLSS